MMNKSCKMKRILALALAIVMMLSMTACGSKGATLDAVKKAGKLTVATSPDFPPFESLEGGEVVGIEVKSSSVFIFEMSILCSSNILL